MTVPGRASNMDVSNTVDVTDPDAVCAALRTLISPRYPDFEFESVETLFRDFARLYRGEYPGFHACDLQYHDLQHVLDVTLAMGRLMEGYSLSNAPQKAITAEMVLVGVACALFHDSGYIRRKRDTRHSNGAAYTRIHVSRSARFLAEYLPTVGLEDISPVCQRLVHFTGYELNPEEIEIQSEWEWVIGTLLGTADLIAQMADVDYLRKCRDYLYSEFEAGGMAGQDGSNSSTGVIYQSPSHLLKSTPNFINGALTVRLDGYFSSAYRYAETYFGGPNLYMETIAHNSARLEEFLVTGEHHLLSSIQP